MRLDGGHHVLELCSLLHAAGSSDSKKPCDRDFALSAAASEAGLAPLYGASQGTFDNIVGRLNAFVAQECEESFKVLQQRQSEIGDVFITAAKMAVGQRKEFLLQRNRPSDQLLACEGTISDAGPVAKSMP